MVDQERSILQILDANHKLDEIDRQNLYQLNHLASFLRKRLCIIFSPRTATDSEMTITNLVCYDAVNKKVKEIALHNERMQRSLDFLSIFRDLTALRLHKCHLRSIPAWFSSYRSLEFLDLSENQLKTLPSSLLSLIQLTDLNLSYNELHFLPPWVEQFPNLHFLHIEANPFQAIPWCVRKYKHETFNISLVEWNERFRLTGHLRYLMMNMRIQEINHQHTTNRTMLDYRGGFNWLGDSEDLWLQTVENHAPQSDEMPMDTFLTHLSRLMNIRSDLILTSIMYKIKENIPLDPLEITHPDLPKWRAIIEATYNQFQTEIGKIILDYINNSQQIEVADFTILL